MADPHYWPHRIPTLTSPTPRVATQKSLPDSSSPSYTQETPASWMCAPGTMFSFFCMFKSSSLFFKFCNVSYECILMNKKTTLL